MFCGPSGLISDVGGLSRRPSLSSAMCRGTHRARGRLPLQARLSPSWCTEPPAKGGPQVHHIEDYGSTVPKRLSSDLIGAVARNICDPLDACGSPCPASVSSGSVASPVVLTRADGQRTTERQVSGPVFMERQGWHVATAFSTFDWRPSCASYIPFSALLVSLA
jgi:hypothetical protein